MTDVLAQAQGATRVRTPDAAQLRALLDTQGASVNVRDDGVLMVDLAPERVGELAAANGVVLHELAVESATLEEVVLRAHRRRDDAVSALVASELLKIRTTRSFWGYVAAIVAAHRRRRGRPHRFDERVRPHRPRLPARARRDRRRRGRHRDHPRDHDRHERVPARDDHADVPRRAAARAGARREVGRRSRVRPCVRGPRVRRDRCRRDPVAHDHRRPAAARRRRRLDAHRRAVPRRRAVDAPRHRDRDGRPEPGRGARRDADLDLPRRDPARRPLLAARHRRLGCVPAVPRARRGRRDRADENLLSYWPGVLVSLAWIALLGAAGTWRTLRRDIT